MMGQHDRPDLFPTLAPESAAQMWATSPSFAISARLFQLKIQIVWSN